MLVKSGPHASIPPLTTFTDFEPLWDWDVSTDTASAEYIPVKLLQREPLGAAPAVSLSKSSHRGSLPHEAVPAAASLPASLAVEPLPPAPLPPLAEPDDPLVPKPLAPELPDEPLAPEVEIPDEPVTPDEPLPAAPLAPDIAVPEEPLAPDD